MITDWQEGRSLSIDITDGEGVPPFENASGTLDIRPQDGGTIARFRFDYGLKYGPLGGLMDALMVRKAFLQAGEGLLAGLKHHVETGAEIDSREDLPIEAAMSVAA